MTNDVLLATHLHELVPDSLVELALLGVPGLPPVEPVLHLADPVEGLLEPRVREGVQAQAQPAALRLAPADAALQRLHLGGQGREESVQAVVVAAVAGLPEEEFSFFKLCRNSFLCLGNHYF